MPKRSTAQSTLSTAARLAMSAASALGTGPAKRAAKSIAKRGLMGGILRQFTHPYQKRRGPTSVLSAGDGGTVVGPQRYLGTGVGGSAGANSYSFSRAPARSTFTHGLRISGTVRFGTVFVDAGGTKISFISADAGTVSTAANAYDPVVIAIDPNTNSSVFSGSAMLQNICGFHSRYRFDRIGFRMTSYSNVGNSGAFGYAYSAEPSPSKTGSSGNLLLDRQGAISISPWLPGQVRTDVNRGTELFYVSDPATGSTADATIIGEISARQCHQGAFMCNVVQPVTASQNGHQVFFDFVLDLYDHRSSSSLTPPNTDIPNVSFQDRFGNLVTLRTQQSFDDFRRRYPQAKCLKTEKSADSRDDNSRDSQLRRLVTDDVREDYISLPRAPPLSGGGVVAGAGGASRPEAIPRPAR